MDVVSANAGSAAQVGVNVVPAQANTVSNESESVAAPLKLQDDVVTLSGEVPTDEPEVGTGLPPTPQDDEEPPAAEPDVGTGLPPTPAASTNSSEQSIGTGLPDRP